MEKGRQTKTLVPCPWVNLINNCVYWSPKGKCVGVCVAAWCPPKKDWKVFTIIETLLEAGTKSEATQMLNMPSASEGSDLDDG